MSVRITATSLMAGAVAIAAVPVSAASDARVEAFRAACISDRQDFEAILVRASSGGWKVVTGEADPALKAVLAASADPAAGSANSIRAFRKEIDGRPTFLVTSRVTSGQYVLVGCYLYDFTATTPLAPELFNDWLGGPPAAEMNEPGNAVGYQWGNAANASRNLGRLRDLHRRRRRRRQGDWLQRRGHEDHLERSGGEISHPI
jgi:hypothetical protein